MIFTQIYGYIEVTLGETYILSIGLNIVMEVHSNALRYSDCGGYISYFSGQVYIRVTYQSIKDLSNSLRVRCCMPSSWFRGP
jgi:hypothetical protein